MYYSVSFDWVCKLSFHFLIFGSSIVPTFCTIRPPQGIACIYQHIQQGAYFSVHKGALITCLYGSMIENNQVEQMNLLLYVNPYYYSMI